MPYLYVYSPDDFVSAPPSESGGAASGSPNFTLTLRPDATPTLVEVTDNDAVFHEVGDSTQTLTNDIDLDGTTYTAGTAIWSAYDLIDSSSGHKITSLHFGSSGYQQGAVDGIVSTEPLVPGQSYTFDTERTSYQQNNEYDDYFACFVTGSLIETKRGQIPVEELQEGDMIATRDNGWRPLRKLLSRRLSAGDLANRPKLRPICISAGALGTGLPLRDLWVSPQHRMLLRSRIARRMFDSDEVLIAATKLTALPGIYPDPQRTAFSYYHLVMDAHEIIWAEGCESESFYIGPQALKTLTTEAKDEMLHLFPELAEENGQPVPARVIPRPQAQKRLIERHRRNHKPLLMAL